MVLSYLRHGKIMNMALHQAEPSPHDSRQKCNKPSFAWSRRQAAVHGPAELQLPNNVELPDRMPMSVDGIVVPMQQIPSQRTKQEGR
jgi:hypothetical protein